MKRYIAIVVLAAFMINYGVTALADTASGSGQGVEVIPGDWGDDDDEQKLNFGFKGIPQASFEDLRLILKCDIPDIQILYTLNQEADVSDAEAWILYSDPIALDADCTVRFFSRIDKNEDSDIQCYDFTYADWQTETPSVEFDADVKQVTMTCATDGAVIRYTTDGNEPTATSQLYAGPIEVSDSMTIKARAFAEGLFDSGTAEIEVSVETGVERLAADGDSIRIERGSYGIAVISDKDCNIPVFTVDGCLVRNLRIVKGCNNISSLDRGVYIIAGKKVRL